LTSVSREAVQNLTSNDRGIGNAQFWGVIKIIIGISYRNLRESKKLSGVKKFRGVNKLRGRGRNI